MKRITQRTSVPPFQADLHRKVDSIREIVRKGLIVDSEDITAATLPDGRVQLKLRNPISAAASSSSTPPAPGPPSGGTFTEFYCKSTGSNLNAGSTTGAAAYTSLHGNWNGTTIFTVQDGTNPSLSVSVGDFVSIMPDGTSGSTPFVARVSAVQNAINGTITINSSFSAGAAPSSGTGTRTLIAGGAWQGPNAAIGFPLDFTGIGQLQNVAGNHVRVNFKNDADYSITGLITTANPQVFTRVQGYSSTPGDGGRAKITSSTNTQLLSTSASYSFTDFIFNSTATTGTSANVGAGTGIAFYRCIFSGARGTGLVLGAGLAFECEAFDCNKSNTSGLGGFSFNSSNGAAFVRCYSHNHAGSNGNGLVTAGGSSVIQIDHCIFESCGGIALNMGADSAIYQIRNCDFYNNTDAAISVPSGSGFGPHYLIENCNFLKNAYGIRNQSALGTGLAMNNGYGAGSLANTNANVLGDLIELSPFTYPADVSPWTDSGNGNFTIVRNGPAYQIGRGVFTETGSGKSGTVGTPNIGAA